MKTFAGQKAKITTVRGFADLAKKLIMVKLVKRSIWIMTDVVLIIFLPDHDENIKRNTLSHIQIKLKNKTDKNVT